MKIAIAGYGVEGKASYDYWAADPSNELTILDERADGEGADFPADAHVVLGPGVFDKLDNFDLVIRTAGLAPHKLNTTAKIWSATNEFFEKCEAHIIGVTGSKGKGTTASFVASMLRQAGKTVWMVGNIGVPALEVLHQISPDDIVVYELSSFQLWDLQYSPRKSIVLFIEPDHLDVHRDFNEYVQAKARIVAAHGADDTVIYNADNIHARAIAQTSKGTKIPYPHAKSAYIKNGFFWYGSKKLCPTSAVQLRGEHNLLTAVAAIDADWEYTQDAAVIEAGLKAFAGLPHRLAFVRQVHSVSYYDDSIATTPTAAIAGLRAFGDQPKVLIVGGSYKGSDFAPLANELTAHDVWVLLIGDEAQRIAKACDTAGFTQYEIMTAAAKTGAIKAAAANLEADPVKADAAQTLMQRVVARAAQLATHGGVVVLSPAAASFGLFKNYADRGEQFIAAVNSL